MKNIFAIAVLLIYSASAQAGFLTRVGQYLVDLGSPDTGQASEQITAPPPTAKPANKCDPAKEAQDRLTADKSEVSNGIKNHVNLSCLEKYKKFSMGAQLGYPNPWDLAQQALGQACSAADMELQGAVAPINQGVALPGGVGRVNTAAVFGNNATGANVSVDSSGSSSSTTGGLSPGGSGYTVPPLWK